MELRGALIGLLALASLVPASLATPAAATGAAPLYGVTLDDVSHAGAVAGDLAALPERPTARVYFEVHEPPSHYARPLRPIHAVSGVMGELLDSSDERAIGTQAFAARVRAYVQALTGEVDIWEVGNEVNGAWTGPYGQVAAKLSEAWEAVAAAGRPAALTLYANEFGPANCGDAARELTPLQFSRRYVPARIAQRLDYVLLSYYPTQCGGVEPSNAALRAELEALHSIYPHAELGFGEVGLPRPATAATLPQAEQIMRWAYSLDPGLPYYAGGYFWWYAAEDALPPGAPLHAALPAAFEAEAAALR